MTENINYKYLDNMRVKSIIKKKDIQMKLQLLNAENSIHEVEIELKEQDLNRFSTEYDKLIGTVHEIELMQAEDKTKIEIFSKNMIKICNQNDEINQGIKESCEGRKRIERYVKQLDEQTMKIMTTNTKHEHKMEADRYGKVNFST